MGCVAGKYDDAGLTAQASCCCTSEPPQFFDFVPNRPPTLIAKYALLVISAGPLGK
jgi:hypothetical protein